MEDILYKINNDLVSMIIIAIVVVIVIFVLLMVVISSMRIKGYKNRYININIDNQDKEATIQTLQEELDNIKIINAQQEQKLQHYSETKDELNHKEIKLDDVKTSLNNLKTVESETRVELAHSLNNFENLNEKYKLLKNQFIHIQDDNNKLRATNTRLLMKFETEN